MFFDGKSKKKRHVDFGGGAKKGFNVTQMKNKFRQHQKELNAKEKREKPSIVIQSNFRRILAFRRVQDMCRKEIAYVVGIESLQNIPPKDFSGILLRLIMAYNKSSTDIGSFHTVVAFILSQQTQWLKNICHINKSNLKNLMLLSTIAVDLICSQEHLQVKTATENCAKLVEIVFRLAVDTGRTGLLMSSLVTGKSTIHFHGRTLPEACTILLSEINVSKGQAPVFEILGLLLTNILQNSSESVASVDTVNELSPIFRELISSGCVQADNLPILTFFDGESEDVANLYAASLQKAVESLLNHDALDEMVNKPKIASLVLLNLLRISRICASSSNAPVFLSKIWGGLLPCLQHVPLGVFSGQNNLSPFTETMDIEAPDDHNYLRNYCFQKTGLNRRGKLLKTVSANTQFNKKLYLSDAFDQDLWESLLTEVQSLIQPSFIRRSLLNESSVTIKTVVCALEIIRFRGIKDLANFKNPLLSIISGVAFSGLKSKSDNILRSIWVTVFNDLSDCGSDLDEFFRDQTRDPKTLDFFSQGIVPSLSQLQMISFASSCTLLLFRSLDDDQILQKQHPLEKSFVQAICLLLKAVLHSLLWVSYNETYDDTSDSPQKVYKQNAVNLMIDFFNILYDLDIRHHFLGAELWLFPTIPGSEFRLPSRSNINVNLFPTELVANVSDDEQDEEDSRLEGLDRVSVRLGNVLNRIPQTIPFADRAVFFTQVLEEKQEPTTRPNPFFRHRDYVLNVRRGHIFDDSFKQLFGTNRLSEGFRVQFVNDHGLPEAGIDGGGLFKEFLNSFIKEAFEQGPLRSWETTDAQLLYPSGRITPEFNSFDKKNLERVTFTGSVLAKGICEGIVIAPRFAPFFFNSLVGKQNKVNDLRSYDPVLFKSLMSLKTMNDDELKAVGLRFEWTTKDKRLIPLKKNGTKIDVTPETKFEYISRVVHYLLNKSFSRQVKAFVDGFTEVISQRWLRVFSGEELQLLMGGSPTGYDVLELKKFTVYNGTFFAEDLYIQWFWEVLQEFSQDEKEKFLSFVTSCPRPPLQGFAALNPKFGISEVEDSSRLPTASTCVNLLKLPRYSGKEQLKERLLYSINQGAGFDLS